jgi:hypothetical protein
VIKDESFSKFLTYKIWKSHAGQNQVGLGDFQHRYLIFGKKIAVLEGPLIVMIKKPFVCPMIWFLLINILL